MSYLYRTASFGSSNDSSCVLSFWIKKTKNDTLQGLFLGWNNSSNYATCYVNNDDTIYYKEKQGGTQYETRITSVARKFRDTNAWYHFVFQWDYTQASASNRIKVWINGELQTWENTGNLPPQNNTLRLKSSDFRIGDYTHAGSNYYNWKGLMSHVHFIDDATYDTYQASTFGETDSTTGEWKIKPDPGIATNNYGSQGFFVLKDGNSGTDQSGKGNNLSTSGTITKTEDCPSNVFCTLNPLTNQGSYTFAHGNTYLEGNNTNAWTKGIGGTLAAKSGKYYWEVKQSPGSHTDYNIFGFMKADNLMDTSANLYSSGNMNSIQTHTTSVTIYGQTGTYSSYIKINGSTVGISDNDIVSFALDLDNRKCWLAKNGVWVDDKNGNTNGSSINTSYPLWGTGEITADTSYTPTSIQYYDPQCYYNFGNGYFGNTAISSAGTNASNNGIFEYDVPSGFTALSTKGLNL